MGDISRLIDNVKSLDLNKVVADSMEATATEMVAAQREQMLHGENQNGKKIGRYSQPNGKYAQKKYAMNPLAGLGNVDLKLTGAFQKDQFIDIRDNSVVFSSFDIKTATLVKRYGNDIFGLNDDYRGAYVKNHLQPQGVSRIKEQILK